ncbi:MAG: hypothetical protein ABEH83_09420, partial [Halobacterium sp.]
EHGDRRTEFVVIGTDVEEDALRDRLDDALVTDDEWADVSSLPDGPFADVAGEEVVLREPETAPSQQQ